MFCKLVRVISSYFYTDVCPFVCDMKFDGEDTIGEERIRNRIEQLTGKIKELVRSRSELGKLVTEENALDVKYSENSNLSIGNKKYFIHWGELNNEKVVVKKAAEYNKDLDSRNRIDIVHEIYIYIQTKIKNIEGVVDLKKILINDKGDFIGIVIKYLYFKENKKEIPSTIENYLFRGKKKKSNYKLLARIFWMICHIVEELHENDIVVNDISERNFLFYLDKIHWFDCEAARDEITKQMKIGISGRICSYKNRPIEFLLCHTRKNDTHDLFCLIKFFYESSVKKWKPKNNKKKKHKSKKNRGKANQETKVWKRFFEKYFVEYRFGEDNLEVKKVWINGNEKVFGPHLVLFFFFDVVKMIHGENFDGPECDIYRKFEKLIEERGSELRKAFDFK